MTIEPKPAGPTFARCALRGAHAGPNGLPMDTNIYIYIYIYIYIPEKCASQLVHIARYARKYSSLRSQLFIFIHARTIRTSVCNFVYSRDLGRSCGQYSTTNCRCDVSAFDLRRSMHRLSKIDVSTFEYRCVALRRSMSQCVDLRRSMCRLSKIDVSTFGDGCVDLRRPMIDVSTFEDR